MKRKCCKLGMRFGKGLTLVGYTWLVWFFFEWLFDLWLDLPFVCVVVCSEDILSSAPLLLGALSVEAFVLDAVGDEEAGDEDEGDEDASEELILLVSVWLTSCCESFAVVPHTCESLFVLFMDLELVSTGVSLVLLF